MMKKLNSLKVVMVFGAMFVMAGGLMLGLSGCNGEQPVVEEPEEAAVEDAIENQQYCPVMEGLEIDPDLYADHEGQRVYFCCAACIDEFQNDPEKYIEKLEELHDEDHDHGDHDHGDHDHDHHH